MPYTYIELQREQSLLHSYIHAMIILDNGKSFEFIHNFPGCGKVSIISLLDEWTQQSVQQTSQMLSVFVKQWRNRRKWVVLKNKHFFDCFIVPVAALKKARGNSIRHSNDEWWINRF